ncbi:hypothetical protein HOD29_01475 [archaeon]|jgi:hypothetical protein|nr:hypothetical protein [archaeon]
MTTNLTVQTNLSVGGYSRMKMKEKMENKEYKIFGGRKIRDRLDQLNLNSMKVL